MGAASENRFKAKCQRETDEMFAAMRIRDDMQRAVDLTVRYEELAREALSAVVDPRGLCKAYVLGAPHRRGWETRLSTAIHAHNKWVGSDHRDVFEHLPNARDRAEAYVALARFAYGGFWRLPFEVPAHFA